MKAFLKNYPIILTILVLGLTIIISQIVTQLTGHMEYSLILSALIIIGITFLLKMPKEMLVTSKLKVKTLKFRPYVMAGRVFNEEESLTLWVSADKNKMPLKIKADLAVCSLRADLSQYKGLKHSFQVQFD